MALPFDMQRLSIHGRGKPLPYECMFSQAKQTGFP